MISLAAFPRTTIRVNGVLLTGNIDSGCDVLCLPDELSRERHVPVGILQVAHTAWGDERMLVSTLPVQFDAAHRSSGTVVAMYARNDFMLIGTSPICDCGEVLFMKGSRVFADSDPEIGKCIFRAIKLLPVPVVSLDGTHLANIDTGASTSAFFSGQDPAPLAHYVLGKGHFHLKEREDYMGGRGQMRTTRCSGSASE